MVECSAHNRVCEGSTPSVPTEANSLKPMSSTARQIAVIALVLMTVGGISVAPSPVIDAEMVWHETV